MTLTSATYRKGDKLLSNFRQVTLVYLLSVSTAFIVILNLSTLGNAVLIGLMALCIYPIMFSIANRRVASFEQAQVDESGIRLVNLLGKTVFVPLEDVRYKKTCLAIDNNESRPLVELHCSRLQPITISFNEYDSGWTYFSKYHSTADFQMDGRNDWNRFIAVLERYSEER